MTVIELPTHKHFRDLTGQRFGRLLVTEFAGMLQKAKWKKAHWVCVCDCGKTITAHGAVLMNGNTSSCGCFKRESIRTRMITHGQTCGHLRSTEFRIWEAMKARCFNQDHEKWNLYGGRGITVCERWLKFENFFEDMGNRPSIKHSIDRFPNNDGNYEPGNCRWATQTQQCRNQRSNRIIEIDGESYCLAEWAEILGVTYNTLWHRISRNGSAEKVISTLAAFRRVNPMPASE